MAQRLPGGPQGRDTDEQGKGLVSSARAACRAVVAAGRGILVARQAVVDLIGEVASLVAGDWGGDKWFPRVIAASLGGVFFLFDGFGLEPFASTTVATVLAWFATALPVIKKGFDYLEQASAGELAEQSAGHVPDLERQLEDKAKIRQVLNLSVGGKTAPNLRKTPFAWTVLDDSRGAIAGYPGMTQVSMLVVRFVRGKFRVEVTRGLVDDDYRQDTEWTFNQVMATGVAFQTLMTKFDYEFSTVAFELGSTQYFLVAMSQSRFTDNAILRTSDAATFLVQLTCAELEGKNWRTVYEDLGGGSL